MKCLIILVCSLSPHFFLGKKLTYTHKPTIAFYVCVFHFLVTGHGLAAALTVPVDRIKKAFFDKSHILDILTA